MVMHGEKYPQGIFAHAPSVFVYKLGKKYTAFISTIGLQDSINCTGGLKDGVVFIVQLDGKEIYKSPITTDETDPVEIQLTVATGNELKLIVDPLKDNDCDWAIWGDARLH